MSDNSSRQIQAEQQVARLEREAESLRARLKAQNRTTTPAAGNRSKLDDLESKNFQLEEQVKDLRFQLSNKQSEASKFQETLTKRSAEHDEKLKKMRGIFAQASKQLDEYRATISAKDKELAELKGEAEAARNIADESQSELGESRKNAERLSAELKSQVSGFTTQIDQLSSKLRQSTTQLDQVKTEYQQYKQRANALLKQKSNEQGTAGESKIGNLEARLKELELENIDKSEELKTSYGKLTNAENDLEQAVAQITMLEKELRRIDTLEIEKDDLRARLEDMTAKVRLERVEFETALQEQEQRHAATIQSLRSEIKKSSHDVEERLAEKESENEDLQRISEHLSNQLTLLREELSRQAIELQETKTHVTHDAATVPGLERSEPNEEAAIRSTATLENDDRSVNEGVSLSELLASDPNLDDAPKLSAGFGNSARFPSDQEKSYDAKLRHFAELLNESEVNVQRLTEQEKLLKEEIRKMDRSEKRQDLKVDYLKSVVLKFFEVPGSAREPLIPVISKVLYLSPEEEKQLHKSSVQNGSVAPKSGMLW